MRSKKGFTIVELVIVIAVIAILTAVLVPVISNVIGGANKSACLQSAKSKFNEIYAYDFADGKIDGASNGNDFVNDDCTIKDDVLKGYENCKYNVKSDVKRFVYSDGKYTFDLDVTDGKNEWKLEMVTN